MTSILVDHDIESQAAVLQGTLLTEGWLELVSIDFVTFTDVSLPITSSDRSVWRMVQLRQMLLLTNNRNMDDEDSLELTIREESTVMSVPVLTIGTIDRMTEPDYRRRCAARLVEIVLYLEDYLGTGRIFIP